MNDFCPSCGAYGFTVGGICSQCGFSSIGLSAVSISGLPGDIASDLPRGTILLEGGPGHATVLFPGSTFARHDVAALQFADDLVHAAHLAPSDLAIFTTQNPIARDFDLASFLDAASDADSMLLMTDVLPAPAGWIERSVPEDLGPLPDTMLAFEPAGFGARDQPPIVVRGDGGPPDTADDGSALPDAMPPPDIGDAAAAPPPHVVRGNGGDQVDAGDAEAADGGGPVAADATGDVTPAAPAEVPRVLEGRAPQQAVPGKDVSIRVRIAQGERAGAVTLANLPHVPAEGLDVTLFLDAPGFTPSHLRETLRVPSSGDSEWKLFDLAPKTVGSFTVEVSAFAGSQFLGTLQMQIAVVEEGASDELVASTAAVTAREGEAGDAVLIVRYDDASKTYRYQWQEDLLTVEDEVSGQPLLATPKDAVEGLVRELNKLARANPYTGDQTRKWLRGKGMELWEQFIPQPLKDHFWERIGNVKRLVIMTAGDPVPWELLYPSAPGKDIGFLVEAVPVVRWRFGGGPVRALPLADGQFVLPPNSPTSASDEIAALRGRLSGSGIQSGADVATLDDLLAMLDAPPGVLHFACHNTFSADAGGSRVAFGAAPFEPTFLREYRNNPWKGRPMVFMNACRTDGQAPLYTSLSGWAEAFLDAGAGTFIGSLWEVRDSSARSFAEAFYGALLSRKNLGEAIQEARTAIRDLPGDPTWLAYTVYGDPAAVRI